MKVGDIPYDSANYLSCEEEIAAYVTSCAEENDPALMADAGLQHRVSPDRSLRRAGKKPREDNVEETRRRRCLGRARARETPSACIIAR